MQNWQATFNTLTNLIFFTILTLCVFTSICFAKPTISDISVISSNNETYTVTVKGAGFGPQPRILVYDDFESGKSGDAINLDGARIGNWFDVNTPPVYSNKTSKSGTNSLIVMSNGTRRVIAAGKKDSSQRHGRELFTEIFVSWWIKDMGDFIGRGGTKTSFPEDSSTKEIWTMLGNRGDNTSQSCKSGECAGHDIWTPGMGGAPQKRWSTIGGNNTHADGSRNLIYGLNGVAYDGHSHWRFGDWNRWYFWYKLDTKNPYGYTSSAAIGFFNPEILSYERGLGTMKLMDNQKSEGVPEAAWDRIKIPGWYRKVEGQHTQRHIDDIYIAIGPNAQARLEIGNNANYEECTKLKILPAKNWGSSQINFDLADSVTSTFDSMYLFFIDGSGNVINPGKKLALGSGNQSSDFQVPEPPNKTWVESD